MTATTCRMIENPPPMGLESQFMRFATWLLGLAVATGAAQGLAVGIDATALFAQLDANHDRRLSYGEAGAAHARLFERLLRTSDADRDARLTAEEFAAGLTPIRAEKAFVEKHGSRTPGGDALIALVAMMDADQDMRLEADEGPAQLRTLFMQMLERGDADQNGRLDAREIAQSGPQLGILAQRTARQLGIDVQAELARLPANRRQTLEQMGAYPRPEELPSDPDHATLLFDRMDANDDGQLSADETPEAMKRIIERGDRDGDGQLSQREYRAIAQRMAGMAGAGVSDGLAADAAFRLNLRQLLRRADRDGDGFLAREEAPPRIAARFKCLDANGDELLDTAELSQFLAAPGARSMNRPSDDERP